MEQVQTKKTLHIYISIGIYQVTLTVQRKKTPKTYTQIVIVKGVSACFTITGTNHYVREPVYFVNCSQNAISYDWGFGDGFTSNQRNPDHVYETSGTYQVTMTAYGEYTQDYDKFTDAVTIQESTDLNILVMFEGLNIIVPNSSVFIYGTLLDWQDDTNVIVSGTTDAKGIVEFVGLNPIIYYVWAELQGEGVVYNNVDLGNSTAPLIFDEVNYYTFYIQEDLTKAADRSKMLVTKVEKSSKEEHDRIIELNRNK